MNSEEHISSADVPDYFEMLVILKIYCYTNKSRIKEECGFCGTHGEENAYGILLGKRKGKGLLGRPRRRYDGNIKWILKN